MTFWHRMADERPTDEDASYLLLGNGGGMYVGWVSPPTHADGSMDFHIPNHCGAYMNSRKVKAWAEVPPYEEVEA